MEKRIKAFAQGYRQNIALLGDDPQEISYLLENYIALNKPGDIIYLHASTAYSEKKDFFKTVAFSLLSDYLNQNDTLDNLINNASLTLQSTTGFIKDCLKKENYSFLSAIEVINKFINESSRRCVLIIEEFLGLSSLFKKDFYQDFSKFIILQRNCMIILTTSYPKEAQRVLAGELNLLFGNFEKVFLNEATPLDNLFYFKNRLKPFEPSSFFLSFFVNNIGSNIIHYDLFSKAIKANYRKDDEESSIIDTLEETLYLKQTYFFQKFMKNIETIKFNFKDFASVIKLLCSLSEGYLRKKELTPLGIYGSKELNSKLSRLIDLNYVENLGDIYKLKDPLFSFWLSRVFKLHFSSAFGSKERRALYRKAVKEELAVFKEDFLKDEPKRVLQLFSSFKNDNLKLGKNKYSLPSMENIKIISYPDNGLHLVVGEGKEIIFAGIKEDNAIDSDIVEFIEKGANVKGKRIKKIFISLGRLSAEAKLIAKNNRLIIWDTDELNRLLSVYNRPIVPYNTLKQETT